MSRFVRAASIVLALSAAVPLRAEDNPAPAPAPATSERFRVGQVWRYATRNGEEGSRVHVGSIESVANGSVIVVHVKLTGLHLTSAAGTGSVIGHMPFSEGALADSVTELTDDPADLEGLLEGHAGWLEAYRSGTGGWFTIHVAEAVDVVQRTIDGGGRP